MLKTSPLATTPLRAVNIGPEPEGGFGGTG